MAGRAYTIELVDLPNNAQGSADYLTIFPLGKVPLLVVDGAPLVENMAILTYLSMFRPDCGLFSRDPSPWFMAETIGGLSSCAGTVHVQLRGPANPQRLTTGDVAPVREKSVAAAGREVVRLCRAPAGRARLVGRRADDRGRVCRLSLPRRAQERLRARDLPGAGGASRAADRCPARLRPHARGEGPFPASAGPINPGGRAGSAAGQRGSCPSRR